jgi:hypothetical protein
MTVREGDCVLINKMALSSFQFNSPNALLCFQCIICLSLVKLGERLRLIKLEPFNMEIVQAW